MSRQPSPESQASSKTHHPAQDPADATRGKLSVREAGRKGGLRVRELINRGREVEARQSEQRPH
jgi:hypothetical protein